MVTGIMLFAAGLGKRLRPLTETTPKCLVRVAGKPLIEHHLQRLAALGAEHVVINLAWLGDQVEAYLGDGSRWGLQISYSREPEAHNPLNTGAGLRYALPLLGNGPILTINADVWTDYPFDTLISADLAATQLAHLVMVANPDGHSGDFVWDAHEGRLLPLKMVSTQCPALTFSGIALVSPKLVSDCSQSRFSIAEPLHRAVAAGQIGAEYFTGRWNDVGTPGTLRALRERYGA